MDDDFRAYQDVLSVGVRILQPDAEVETADLESQAEAVETFQPEVLISDQPEPENSGGWAIWVELSVDPIRPTKVSACGHSTERTNPTLEELLDVIEKVKQLHWPNKALP